MGIYILRTRACVSAFRWRPPDLANAGRGPLLDRHTGGISKTLPFVDAGDVCVLYRHSRTKKAHMQRFAYMRFFKRMFEPVH